MSTMRSHLRWFMTKLGNVVERIIGGASRGGGAQPVLSLEAQVPIQKLRDVVAEASMRLAASYIPALIDKTALEISERTPAFGGKFKEKGASIIVHASIGPGTYAVKDAYSVKCQPARVPFEDGFFDFILAILATQYQGDIIKDIKEVARLLTVGGDAILVDFHPFGLYARRGAGKMWPTERTIRGMEDYYKCSRLCGLKVLDLREVFIDEGLRGMFTSEEEKASYRIIRETPLLVALWLRRG